MCSPVIILKWAICDIGPPVMVNGTYGTVDFSPVFVIEQDWYNGRRSLSVSRIDMDGVAAIYLRAW